MDNYDIHIFYSFFKVSVLNGSVAFSVFPVIFMSSCKMVLIVKNRILNPAFETFGDFVELS